MKRAPTHRKWLLRYGGPSLLLTAITAIWGAAVGVYTYRMLGVMITSVNGRAPTFIDEVLLHGLDPLIGAFMVNALFLGLIFAARIRFRWWLAAALCMIIGTPVALFAGWQIVDYLWSSNRGGTPWEGIVPVPIGLSISWIASFAAEMALDRVAFLRQRGAVANPCPRCGYDLLGNESGACPECGRAVRVESA